MIFDTFNSQSVCILNDAPNWRSAVQADLEFAAIEAESLSGRSCRRGFSGSIRWKLKFDVLASGSAALAIVGGFRTLVDQPVLVPFWPGLLAWSDRASSVWTGALKIVWKDDWSQWELFTTSEPSWPSAADNWAPVMWGRLDRRTYTTPDVELVDLPVEFSEAGDYPVTPASQSWTAGPSLTGYGTAPRLFPFAPDFDEPESGSEIKLVRDSIGFRKDAVQSSYASTPHRLTALEVLLSTGADISKAARWFLDYAGGGPFWAPNPQPCARLASNISGGATSFTVASASAIASSDRLALCNAGSVIQTCKVSSIASNTVNVTAALSAANADDIAAHPLLLCHLTKPKLSIRWDDVEVAEIAFAVSEEPDEITLASDETAGTTIGGLAARCYLYELSQSLSGTTYYERWTSFESDVTYSSNTFASRQITHGRIVRGVAIDRDEVDLTTQFSASSMLADLVKLSSELPVMLKIMAGTVSGGAASSVEVLYYGEVTKASLRGQVLSAKAVSGGSMFDRPLPKFFLQPGCNHALFSTGCGLTESSWKFSAVVAATISAAYPFKVELSTLARVTGAAPTFADDWFAGGWIEYGSGQTAQRRAIMSSTQHTSTTLDVYLRRPFTTAPASSATVYLYPGCDGTKETCAAKFSNYANFGGHPFVPSTNPSLMKVSKNIAGGKK